MQINNYVIVIENSLAIAIEKFEEIHKKLLHNRNEIYSHRVKKALLVNNVINTPAYDATLMKTSMKAKYLNINVLRQ